MSLDSRSVSRWAGKLKILGIHRVMLHPANIRSPSHCCRLHSVRVNILKKLLLAGLQLKKARSPNRCKCEVKRATNADKGPRHHSHNEAQQPKLPPFQTIQSNDHVHLTPK